MSVTVDDQPLAADQMGLNTLGELLAHVQRANRLVVHVLIDGQEPDLNRLCVAKQSPLQGHTIYVETAEPKAMAEEILSEVETHLDEADRLKNEAADLLQKNQTTKAMEKLSGCFSTWQSAQESIQKTGQLLRIDLSLLRVGERSLIDVLGDFKIQLRDIKSALESRDFVSLSDILTYETTQTTSQWRDALQMMRKVIRK